VSSPSPRKKPPLIAILAVVVPLLAIAVGALVTTASQDEARSPSTTVGIDGDPSGPSGAAPDGQRAPRPEAGAPAPPVEEGDQEPPEGPAPAAADEVASSPQTAGGEGDRPVVTWPQPTVPAGGCDRPGGSTAVIVLGESARPACLRVSQEQSVQIQNRTGREISFMADNLNEILAAGADHTIGRAADAFAPGRSTFWVQGDPKLSGLIELR
jgi:hypothetical protein